MNAVALRNIEFEEIYENYHPLMSRIAYKKIGNPDDVEDICQDLFLTVYNNIDNIKNMKSWMNTVLRNIICSYYEENNSAGYVVDTKHISNNIRFSIFDGSIDARIILKEIFKNSEIFEDDTEEQIFFLSMIEKKSYSEISSETGLSKRKISYKVEKIKNRIQYCLRLKGIREFDELL